MSLHNYVSNIFLQSSGNTVVFLECADFHLESPHTLILRMRGNRPPRGINFITRGEMAAVSTGVLAVGEQL